MKQLLLSFIILILSYYPVNAELLSNEESEEIITKKETFAKKRNEYYVSQKSPLPHIKNLRKWINNDKKAS